MGTDVTTHMATRTCDRRAVLRYVWYCYTVCAGALHPQCLSFDCTCLQHAAHAYIQVLQFCQMHFYHVSDSNCDHRTHCVQQGLTDAPFACCISRHLMSVGMCCLCPDMVCNGLPQGNSGQTLGSIASSKAPAMNGMGPRPPGPRPPPGPPPPGHPSANTAKAKATGKVASPGAPSKPLLHL